MNRAGLVRCRRRRCVGLAPVVPLLLAHDRDAFAAPNVHIYAVSATALLCAGLALALGVIGVRRHDRRTAGIGAGFTVIAALLAVHGLTTPGFLIDGEYTAAVGVSGALAVPLGGGVLWLRCSRDPAGSATCATSCVADRRRGRAVRLRRAGAARARRDSELPVALRPLVWSIVGVNALIYGVLALRALRTFQLTRRLGDLAVAAGLVWLAVAVATYLLSPVWSVGFWSGHVLELGAFLVVTFALVSDLVRDTPSRASTRDRRR